MLVDRVLTYIETHRSELLFEGAAGRATDDAAVRCAVAFVREKRATKAVEILERMARDGGKFSSFPELFTHARRTPEGSLKPR